MRRVNRGAWLAMACLATACGDDASDAAADAGAKGEQDGGGGAIDQGGECAELPADAVVDPASECTTDPGKWTQYTVSITDAATNAFKQCNLEAAAVYADQAAFDAAEGTSSVASITITSNGDYVRTANCASGSTEYESMGQKTSFLYLWQLEP